jgi:hypothetical protein
MDTKTLVVSQQVWMKSGDIFEEVTVIEITEKYVAVKPPFLDQTKRPWMMRFDRNGKQRDGVSPLEGLGLYEWYEGFAGFTGWEQEDPRLICTKFGPWELTDNKELTP